MGWSIFLKNKEFACGNQKEMGSIFSVHGQGYLDYE